MRRETVNSGMQAKLEAGFAALASGSPTVHRFAEAFTDPAAGRSFHFLQAEMTESSRYDTKLH